jgi:hypothetical protein
MRRMAKRHWFTPIWGLGIGLVDAEYVLSENMIIDGVLDFQYISKMVGERRDLRPGEVYAIAPQIILSYFFHGN